MDNNQIVIYQTEDGLTKIEVNFDSETVWLTQAQISELFQRERSVITKHINNVFSEQELDEESNVQILHIANSDKPVKLYNLDVIISVGYRVKSIRGTHFRRWATERLKELLFDLRLIDSVCTPVFAFYSFLPYRRNTLVPRSVCCHTCT